MAAPYREEAHVNPDALDALILICSATPERTFILNLERQLTTLIKADKSDVTKRIFHFKPEGYSPEISESISYLAFGECLSPELSDKSRITFPALYARAKKAAGNMTSEEVQHFVSLGKRLQTR